MQATTPEPNFTGTGLNPNASAGTTTSAIAPAPTPAAPAIANAGTPQAVTTPTSTPTTPTTPLASNPANALAPDDPGNQYNTSTGQLNDKYKGTLQNLQQSGTQPPTTPGAASAAVQQNTPAPQPPPYNPVKADTIIADDQAHAQFLSDYTQSQQSQAQTETLAQTYSDLSNQVGLPALNTQLINMRQVIDGTEDDIRNEISKSGGFASESQIMALATARNKSIIQNYNNLLQTRDDMQKQVDTMIGLSKQDRDYAKQQIDDKLNFDQKQIEYSDKAVSNAQEALNSMQKSEGWDGIYKAAMASGDPSAIARINSTMGNGFNLFSMAQQDEATKTAATNKENIAQQNIINDNARADKALNETIRHNKVDEAISADENGTALPDPKKANQPGYDASGSKYTSSTAQNEVNALWKQEGALDKNNHIPPNYYNQAKAWWVEQGLKASDFDDILGQYKQQGLKGYN